MDNEKYTLSLGDIRAIESVLAKRDRVEIIPVKDGIKILHIKRETVKPK